MTSSQSSLAFSGQPHEHIFTMSGVTTERMVKMRSGESLHSEPFVVFDRSWHIEVFLNGNDDSSDGRIVAMLKLLRSDEGVSVDVKFTISGRSFDVGITRFFTPDNQVRGARPPRTPTGVCKSQQKH